MSYKIYVEQVIFHVKLRIAKTDTYRKLKYEKKTPEKMRGVT